MKLVEGSLGVTADVAVGGAGLRGRRNEVGGAWTVAFASGFGLGSGLGEVLRDDRGSELSSSVVISGSYYRLELG